MFHHCCTGPVDVKERLKVAVIGAGASGLCAVRHCSKFADRVLVTLYEQGTEIVETRQPFVVTRNGLFPNNAHQQLRLNTVFIVTLGSLHEKIIPYVEKWALMRELFHFEDCVI